MRQFEFLAGLERFGIIERGIEPGDAVAHARHPLEPGRRSERIAALHLCAVGQRLLKLRGVRRP